MKRVAILIWALIAGALISACFILLTPVAVLPTMTFSVGLGAVGLAMSYYYRYQNWTLNRRKNLLPLSYRIKKTRPYVMTSEGHMITLTSRCVIAFLTILTWIITEFVCVSLKLDYVLSFVIACVAGAFVLFSLIGLWISRKRNGKIIKFVPKPKVTRVGIVTVPLLLLGIMGLPFWFEPNGWIVGIGIGGIPAGLLALGMALHVKKSGWKKFSWNDALRPLSNRKWHSVRPHGNPFAMQKSFSIPSGDYSGGGRWVDAWDENGNHFEKWEED